MFDIIWGVKTTAMMDVWTIEHVLSGISVGAFVIGQNTAILAHELKFESSRIMRHFDVLGVLFLAYLWETFEHYLEIGLAGEWLEYWFQGVEFWPNRLIFDPLMLVIGYLIARACPGLVTPARFASLLWLFVHLVVFEHSMALHEYF